MNKKKYRSIACALALATSFTAVNFSPAYAAEDENAVETASPDSPVAATETPAPAETSVPVVANDKLQAWRNNRPQEAAVKESLKAVEGTDGCICRYC